MACPDLSGELANNYSPVSRLIGMARFIFVFLKYSSSLDYSENYGNYCNNQQNVNDTSTITNSNKSDEP